MKQITLDKIKDAYSRFKAYVYYDNFNLLLRAQLAEYENDEKLEEKLKNLYNHLKTYLSNGEINPELLKKIENSRYIVLPKSFDDSNNSQKKNNILISNIHTIEYNVKNTTILFDGDMELHIIATLWILEEGLQLNKKIGKDSYGYHLPINNENKIIAEKLLFTKYFEKYQEWRDKGIRAAKNQIKEGNDVLLISLDIKNFFHSTYIDFNELRKDLGLKIEEPSFTNLIERICITHTKKLQLKDRINKKPLLPIGLVSSGVIANWLLSDFDKEIKSQTTPVYYGRYVDDIFIVVSNVKPYHKDNNEALNEEEIEEKTIVWLEEKFFPKKSPLFVKKNENEITLGFKNKKKYPNLEIQASKIKLFYFSPEWPLALLNKFQKTLEENSSAFWFLPEEESLKDSLDDKAYDMQYEDTINKFRSVADVKTSKYGASVFLAKRIKLAILHSESPNDKITKEIFRFFKGITLLSLYSLWEKVFTYLVVTNDIKAIKKLYKNISYALTKIKNDKYSDKLIDTLSRHLDISLQMAFSLNPSLFEWLGKKDNDFRLKNHPIQNGIKNLRYSLLTRHHYLSLPSLIITDYYIETMESLLSDGLIDNLLKSSSFRENEKILNEVWRIPRWFRLHEVCMYNFLFEIKNWSPNNVLFRAPKDGNKSYKDLYFDKCISLFEKINNRKISNLIHINKYKTYKEKTQIKIDSDSIKIDYNNNDIKLVLGLSNIRLNKNDIKTAIHKRSEITNKKRELHIKHLNLAEQEKVDLLILPETSVPIDWLFAYADEARRKERAFIFGLEHFTVNNYCFNFTITLLPIKVSKTNEVLIIPRLKNHYSPMEEFEINKIGKLVPIQPLSFYHLIKWKGIQFSVYNCYELADVVHRSIFRSDIDMLFAIEYNRDTNYFSNIAESTSRDLHCFFIQANTSEYGDSRVVEPRETIKMNPVRVKGGENNVILRYTIDVSDLRRFQSQRLPYQLFDKSFKTTPPDFDHEKPNKRGN